MARVLITGVTGQIGSYLAEDLLRGGHEVLGVGSPRRTRALPAGVVATRGAWTRGEVDALVRENGALGAVVHLGGVSSVPASWEDPDGTFEANAALTARLVYTLAKEQPKSRLVHASSSNMFGHAPTPVQSEATPLAPVSPYGVAKAAAHLAVRNAREGLGAPATNLIFFMGCSPRSPVGLVVRKITRQVGAVLRGEASVVRMGTMHVVRDVCHAKDFARAAASFALAETGFAPGDYCCASGTGRSIRAMAEAALAIAGLDPARHLEEEPGYTRPSDIPELVGDITRIRRTGWAPSTSFETLLRECIDADREK